VNQWLVNGANLEGATKSSLPFPNNAAVAHGTESTLTLANATRHDTALYSVAVANTGGSTLSNGLLIVLDPAATNYASGFYRVVEQRQ
jgi:hypothetical protein